MDFSKELGQAVEAGAIKYPDRLYSETFNCMDFVRAVYRGVGLTVPSAKLNITHDELLDPPIGYIIFLRHKKAAPEKKVTHVGIIISGRRVIHSSFYFGTKVVITDLDTLLEMYELASA